jgi:hypothetical protein
MPANALGTGVRRVLAGLLLIALATPCSAEELAIRLVTPLGDQRALQALEPEPISLRDLLPFGGISLPAQSGDAVAGPMGLRAVGGSRALPALAGIIERELPLRWQVRLPADGAIDALRVTAELQSPGEPGRLARGESSGAGVPAVVRVEGPWLVSVDERAQVVEGALVLQIPIEALGQRPTSLEAELVLRADYR